MKSLVIIGVAIHNLINRSRIYWCVRF